MPTSKPELERVTTDLLKKADDILGVKFDLEKQCYVDTRTKQIYNLYEWINTFRIYWGRICLCISEHVPSTPFSTVLVLHLAQHRRHPLVIHKELVSMLLPFSNFLSLPSSPVPLSLLVVSEVPFHAPSTWIVQVVRSGLLVFWSNLSTSSSLLLFCTSERNRSLSGHQYGSSVLRSEQGLVF